MEDVRLRSQNKFVIPAQAGILKYLALGNKIPNLVGNDATLQLILRVLCEKLCVLCGKKTK